LLIVNTASKCGFTPQYQELEALWRQYRASGLVVVGFPCNQFGKQEPGSAGDIAAFCEQRFGVTFPMFGKVDVNGRAAHPLFVQLKQRAPGVFGGRIKWNFTKFLVDIQEGRVQRFAPFTKPSRMAEQVQAILG
jgi:glutathione peroxidase